MDEDLLRVARGDAPADLVIRNARVANVRTLEVEDVDLAVAGDRIAGLGRYEGREIVDARGAWLAPGFIDAHIHIESSMMSPAQFARAVVPRGTTAVVCDPHEIANVLGVPGIEYILRAAEGLPLDVHVMLPSCVPATHLETAGARLEAADLAPLFGRPHVLGLAEVMNFPGVVAGAAPYLAKIRAAGDRPVDGHAPGLSGPALCAYIAAGPDSDHECFALAEAVEKARRGMMVIVRDGTVAKNLETLLPLVRRADAWEVAMCCDDRHPIDLRDEGHVDHLLRRAVALGADPLVALRAVTLTPARHYRLRGRGGLTPGAHADFVLLEDLKSFRALRVWKDGREVARDGRVLRDPADVPAPVKASVKLPPEFRPDFTVPARSARIRVIGIVPDQIVTRGIVEEAACSDGALVSDPARDLVKMAVIDRYTGTGKFGLGFARGLGLKRGAIASTVAHDSHNIVVAGVTDDDMRAAVAEIARMGGGQVAASGGKAVASLPLPIAGLMSDRPIEEVAPAAERLRAAARELGSPLHDPFMTLAFLALPVIPELRLTDRGLVDVGKFDFVPVCA
ncbi:MAG: adenine deaminase [Planctomycetes bacterium]|nr:adenine deaminase [Planctomycetota bacterium]